MNKLNPEKEFDIKEATSEDMKHIYGFIRKLAIYEKAEKEVLISEEQLINDGFNEPKRFESLMCFVEGEPAGMCLFYHRYSTWKGLSFYLEDIYIDDRFRRMGIASAFMKILCQIALDRKCGRFEWQVLDWNQSAIDFYKTMGAELDPEWINGKMTPEKMKEWLS